jgi:hypothetical protein
MSPITRHPHLLTLTPRHSRKLQEALHKLAKLHILEETPEKSLIVNSTFRLEFKNALSGG